MLDSTLVFKSACVETACLRQYSKHSSNCKMTTTKKIIQWTLIVGGVGFLLFLGFVVFAFMAFSGAFDTFHTKQELTDN